MLVFNPESASLLSGYGAVADAWLPTEKFIENQPADHIQCAQLATHSVASQTSASGLPSVLADFMENQPLALTQSALKATNNKVIKDWAAAGQIGPP